jgi:F-type H+-transporting ATPase subunit alpha
VGGNAQTKAMRSVAGRLRLDLAQYRELEAFAQFGSDLDAATQKQLARGARLVEVLKQPQYAPMPMEYQVMSIYAATNGHLDDVPVARIRAFEHEFHEYLRVRRADFGQAIRTTGKLDEGTIAQLVEAIKDFKQTFEAESSSPAPAERAKPAPAPAGKSNTVKATAGNPLA